MKSEKLKLPRGLRNNNPLNIRKSGDKWQGLKALQEDKEFFQFESMAYGWRAAFVILCRTYYKRYGLKTISDIIYRWAPPKENNTSGYVKHVSELSGIGSDEPLADPQTHAGEWLLIAIAMAVVENGTNAFDPSEIARGWKLAQ